VLYSSIASCEQIMTLIQSFFIHNPDNSTFFKPAENNYIYSHYVTFYEISSILLTGIAMQQRASVGPE
jgi:hypothetical protein